MRVDEKTSQNNETAPEFRKDDGDHVWLEWCIASSTEFKVQALRCEHLTPPWFK
jgi:hypothetical protein